MKKPEQFTTYKWWHTARLKVQHCPWLTKHHTLLWQWKPERSLYDRQITSPVQNRKYCKPVRMLLYVEHLFAQMAKYLCLSSWHDGLSPPPRPGTAEYTKRFVIKSRHHALGMKSSNCDENCTHVCGFEEQQSPGPKATMGWEKPVQRW